MKQSFAFVATTLMVILLASVVPAQERGDRRGFGGGDRGPGGGDRRGFGGRPAAGGDRSRGGFGGGPPDGGDRSRGGFGGGTPGGGDRSRGGFGGGPPGGGDRGGRPTLDGNGDGRIDQNEINQMSDQMKQLMQSRGITIRPGMSMDDFRNNMREQFSRGGEGGRGGDSQARSRGQNGVLSPFRPRTKERMTVDLPPKYSELDIDYDGQIGLYEWITARRESLSQFDQMDMNFDGVLTPSELLVYDEVIASGEPKVVSYKRERVTIVGGGGSSRSSGSAAIRMGGGEKGSKPSAEEVQKHEATAKRYFAAMDKNKDGMIAEDEWAQSRRLKPFFEKAGIKIRTMSESDFAGKYAKAMKSIGK
jgi:hypothetical protein